MSAVVRVVGPLPDFATKEAVPRFTVWLSGPVTETLSCPLAQFHARFWRGSMVSVGNCGSSEY